MKKQIVRSVWVLLFAAALGAWMFVPFGATAAEAAGPAAVPTCGSVVYVGAGDTLSSIASRCGTTVQAILQANPIVWNPNLIYAGQALTVPPTGTSTNTTFYVVKRGDTLYGIARLYGTSVGYLRLVNPQIINANWIYVGQVLRVPAANAVQWLNYESTRHAAKLRYPSNWRIEVDRSAPGLDNDRETVTLYQPGYGAAGQFTRIWFHAAKNAYVVANPHCDSTQMITGVKACRSSMAAGQNPAQVLVTFERNGIFYSVQIAYAQASDVQVYDQLLNSIQWK